MASGVYEESRTLLANTLWRRERALEEGRGVDSTEWRCIVLWRRSCRRSCRWRGERKLVVERGDGEARQRSNAHAECTSGSSSACPCSRYSGTRDSGWTVGRMHYHAGRVCGGPILLVVIHQLQAVVEQRLTQPRYRTTPSPSSRAALLKRKRFGEVVWVGCEAGSDVSFVERERRDCDTPVQRSGERLYKVA
ncbi:hypothetical protein C8F01DRAFT_799148 [Mycena amicta]|nr:hypothetical protein C8F01DRAFT_799148 [Mycena amicta]